MTDKISVGCRYYYNDICYTEDDDFLVEYCKKGHDPMVCAGCSDYEESLC